MAILIKQEIGLQSNKEWKQKQDKIRTPQVALSQIGPMDQIDLRVNGLAQLTWAWPWPVLHHFYFWQLGFDLILLLQTVWIAIQRNAEWKPLQFLGFVFVYRIFEKLKASEPPVSPTFTVS